MSSDLRAFSKHAKRAGVSTDDVKLLARKAPDLHADLEAFEAEHLAKDPKQPREARKRERANFCTRAGVATANGHRCARAAAEEGLEWNSHFARDGEVDFD